MENERHKCAADEKTIYGSHGLAIEDCVELEDGKLWAGNGEYEQVVKYCPFCGYKSTFSSKEKAQKLKAEGYSMRMSGSTFSVHSLKGERGDVKSGYRMSCNCCEEIVTTLTGIENTSLGHSADKWICVDCLRAMYPNAD